MEEPKATVHLVFNKEKMNEFKNLIIELEKCIKEANAFFETLAVKNTED